MLSWPDGHTTLFTIPENCTESGNGGAITEDAD